MLTLGQLLVLAVKPVNANHDSCSGNAQAVQKCIQDKQNAANVNCFTNNKNNNDAIAACVQKVKAHFEFTGSPANAPALPTGALSAAEAAAVDACKNTTTDTKNCIYQTTQDSQIDGRTINYYGKSCEGKESTACGIFDYISAAIKVLSALIGIVVTGMIIVAGIRYSAAGSEPAGVEKAKKMMGTAILTLVAYGLLFAVAQWLLPGGIL